MTWEWAAWPKTRRRPLKTFFGQGGASLHAVKEQGFGFIIEGAFELRYHLRPTPSEANFSAMRGRLTIGIQLGHSDGHQLC